MIRSTYKKAFLDYYQENNFAPVSQNVTDLNKHFLRRAGLYRQLGLNPSSIEGKDVLEVGPGTGHNALFTQSLKPKNYVLVDGNQASIKLTSETLHKHFDDLSNITTVESELLSYSSNQSFDFVFCEGTIPGQNNPNEFTQHLAKFVKPGGILIVTCVDRISIIADLLRKVGAAIILNNQLDCSEGNVAKLRLFCRQSMSNLPGMSRHLDDWIYDVILHPIVGELFSIEQAIRVLQNNFNVYSSSPQFSTDWRWYKDLCEEDIYNQPFIEQYRSNIHNLLDYRYVLEPTLEGSAKQIITTCDNIYDTALSIFNGELSIELLTELSRHLTDLSANTEILHPNTKAAVNEFNSSLNSYIQEKDFQTTMPEFEKWFSRGQQYLSFIRK